MNKSRLYAFWKYDQPPYLLGAEIDKKDENGSINPKGYGGIWIKSDAVMVIVPYEEGITMQKELDKANKEYNDSVNKARKKLDTKVDKIIKKGKKVIM